MKRIIPLLTLAVAISGLVVAGTPAWAEGQAPGQMEDAGRIPVAAFAAHATLDDARLDGLRGGAENRLSKIIASGTVSEVSASDLVTGHNVVSGGSFANANGMPMLIQNSGNGVLIQNAVILNVEVQ
ncbi:hypothetical protein [Pseudothauera rhizosphaerae]|uniref:Uncharacterized protein n=1 Tax=Pseudothauera rhizosphaerae TaxID=2565932 RepID=A0A4S4ATX0_9RHOO|nr:hypothetical protein [Pseudothauera rhizosphaerae]THF63377.1 hypothetical protein E6O51_04760 [Pseudothauera rhizosphaerae]